MNKLPEFEVYGYKVCQEIGKNYQNGRVTYRGINIKNDQDVVIKQFRFGVKNEWSGNKAIAREIEVLQCLDHLGIPRYLDCFDAGDSVCLVQEYKKAQPLSVPRSFDPEEIKVIAVQVLEILIYLQGREIPIIHRDIKPENILVDEELKVYLVDFGLARLGAGEVMAISSVIAGTPGFMPPEQLLNRTLTTASDLYGLGATLICLLTGTKSRNIGNLIDSNSFQIRFQHLVPKLSLRFIEWLEKMVQPNLKDRFKSAEVAFLELKPLYVLTLPAVELSNAIIELEAEEIGDILMEKIRISNPVADTILEGVWQVEPHQSDPPHTPDYHAWIAIEPAKFVSNEVECKIRVNTRKLMAEKIYERQLKLHTNSSPKTYTLTLKVQTAPMPQEIQQISYGDLVMFALMFAAVVVALTEIGTITVAIAVTLAVAGAIAGMITLERSTFVAVGLIVPGILTGTVALTRSLVGTEAGAVTGMIAGTMAGIVVKDFLARGLNQGLAIVLLLLTAALGVNLGLGFKLGLTHPLIMLAMVITSLPLVTILIFEERQLIHRYRLGEQKQNLIKP
ncbi:MAG: serine/threonine protein kinase [Gomphosphaeria aponina SAG 52.96 = DSM 107014]|uniref:Serine/threonine protein kinase n=1 Tax=Gomphosphaeria aponina SAG 52.96 = DSM 107014 TaxID=1521640 RepID=A0A941GY27_9CHRO|nr:serine/threonine protein kinase [Gomphosphaeria aponina SAG 52.96 = DSM 107014]